MQDLLRRVLRVWEKRAPLTPAQLKALGEEAYLRGWSLAGIWEKRFLERIQESLTGAIQKGMTYSDWTQNEGQKILDGFGAGVSTYRGGKRWDPWYSELVMRNATQASFAGGRYSAMWAPEWQQIAPYWRYYATLDDRTRPTHAALHGRVFRKDDPAARAFLPPWGHACRCQAQELTLAEVEDAGYQITDGNMVPLLPTEGGGTIGRPPGGWGVDRGAANGSRALAVASDPPRAKQPPTIPAPDEKPAGPPPPWHEKFPPVTTFCSVRDLKRAGLRSGERLVEGASPAYSRAKQHGDEAAARAIAMDLVRADRAEAVRRLQAKHPEAIVVPVQGRGDVSNNRLPRALAKTIADGSSWRVSRDIVQAEKVSHSGSGVTALQRLLTPPTFDGPVVRGQVYIIVDDVTTSGSTLAALRHYIAARGGRVVHAVSFAAIDNPRTGALGNLLGITPGTKNRLVEKFDVTKLDALLSRYGAGPTYGHITDSQARFLLSFPNLDAIERAFKGAPK